MSKRWTINDVKNLGIHINQDGVGKKLVPTPKKEVSKEDIQKVLAKLRDGKKK
jgi:hypothetical protein